MATKTVIVESPTKARTIKRYLGDGYQVVSTVGHVRDLPKSSLGVDVEHGFAPDYQLIKGKAKTIKAIRDAVKDADEIFLAPDPDREGEAIAWHIAEILKLPVKRIEFHEVTRRAVLEAIANPREIDLDRVNAQQARRVLDRLVGYQISPLMWRKIKPGLSAGRVQSVAVRLVCDREDEIRAFTAQEYWTFAADFSHVSDKFSATLVKIDGQRLAHPGEEQKRETEVDGNLLIRVSNEAQASEILEDARRQDYSAGERNTREHSRRPQAPFTTSSLQQDAASKLGWTGKRTMSIAQQLYEGVDLGNGQEGLITYMRTDSVRVAPEALESARAEISGRFGENYLPEKPNFYKSKASAQEAHEAIRPTDTGRRPEQITGRLSTDQARLYRIIYDRFIASQMAPARFETNSLEISGGKYLFRASATRTVFDGFLRLYGEGRSEDTAVRPVPPTETGDSLELEQISSEQHFTKAPPRFTDATLVKALEENGIGRPSTYAAIIDTIIFRGYVIRVQKRLEPTEWGYVTTEMMNHYFPNIVDINFTRDMEENLDRVERGEQDWHALISEFYIPFKVRLDEAAGEKKYFKAKPQETEHSCEKCGSVMLLRHGKYGRFISCSAYPECSNIKNIDDKGNIIDRPTSEAGQEIERPCPECGSKLSVKVSRWGTKFIGCSGYPKCRYTSELQTQCPKCGGALHRKRLANRRVILVCGNNEQEDGTPVGNCDFVLWGKPLVDSCPKCGWFLAEQRIKGTDNWRRYCSNPDCENHRGIGADEETAEEAEVAEE